MSHNTEQLGRKLRKIRETIGVSRPQFAQLLGMPPTTLKNYELGYRETGSGVLLTIANHPQLASAFPYLMSQDRELDSLQLNEVPSWQEVMKCPAA